MNQIIEIAAIISAIGTICTFLFGIYKIVRKIEKVKTSIEEQINSLKEGQRETDKSQCKNYLVRFLKDKERGIKLSEIETLRAHEAYNHYTVDLEGNSYIHDQWKKQMGGEK